MAGPAPLVAIIAHARAGALAQAWRLFRSAGLESVTDNPAVLSVKGRLLKDQGRLATGEARRQFYARAAEAYGQAGAIDWTTYPLINAATLSLLAGETERSIALAGKVLARLESGEDAEPDTPYWRTATRSEAYLLLGQTHEAWLALQEAISLAPRAWEDHASTLRQFALILEARGEDDDWLDPLRPPRSLHFCGHLDVSPDDAVLTEAVRDLLREERIGFGYGALAAGADIIIAEALLDHGAELHLVLPAGRSQFREISVAPHGDQWAARFDAVLARAETVITVGSSRSPMSKPALEVSTRSAMGRSVMQARILATEAIQLAILDEMDSDRDNISEGGAIWSHRQWRSAGLRGRVLVSPRVRSGATGALLENRVDVRLMAIAALAPGDLDDEQIATGWLPEVLAAVSTEGLELQSSPSWSGQALILAVGDCVQAARLARAVADLQAGGRTAIDFGVVRTTPLLFGQPLERAQRLLASVPPGATCVTADFATALMSGPEADSWPCEPIGEMPDTDLRSLADEYDSTIFGLRLERQVDRSLAP
ncbi:MAG: DUF4071 domain-containing protein [Caulobacteraceae bacterium]|nr:DUF4071 domain-containing protein [Caulobacteraceae bacterium]